MTYIEMNQDLEDILSIEIENVAKDAPVCPLLLGEPGIGKSSMVRGMCDKKNWNFFEVLCNQLGDRTDLTGCRSVKDTVQIDKDKVEEIWKQIFFPHQSIQNALKCAKQHPDEIVVLFLDEINRTSSDITSAVMSFTTSRTVGTYTFPDNVRFIVAGNDRGNITNLDTACISRFVKFKIRPNANTYMSIEHRLNPYIEQVLKTNPNYIFCKNSNIVTSEVENEEGETYTAEYEAFDDEEGFEQITTPRTISGLNSFLNACDLNKLSYYISQVLRDSETGEETTLLQTIIEGHVGKTAFADAILSLIASDITSGMLQKANNVVAPDKPASYKDIARCTDRQTRDEMIDQLSDEEKSALLVYTVWEKNVDNSDLIKTIAQHFNGQLLTGDYQPQFSTLKAHDELNVDNYTALITSDTPIGTMIRNILGD